jgi:hypothetical protein
MSLIDTVLIQKYRKMMGIGFLSGNGITGSSMSILSSLYITGTNPSIIDNITINNSLNISGYTNLINVSFFSSLYSNTTISNFQNVTVNELCDQSNLTCSTVVSIGSIPTYIINTSYTSVLQNTNIDSLVTTNISAGSIQASNIYLNGQVYITGTILSIFSTSLSIVDNSLVLNSYNGYGLDLGYSSGINFYSSSAVGSIITSSDAKQFLCIVPNGNTQYLLGYDDYYNMSITGTAYIGSSLTSLSSVYCNNISGSLNILNSATAFSMTLNGTIGTILNIDKIISNTFTDVSSLTLTSGTILSNSTMNSVISDSIIASTINSTFYTGTTINNVSSTYNSAIISGNIQGNNLSSTTMIGNSTNIQGYSTIGSILTNLGFINLREYSSNAAAKAGGLPIWSLYKSNGLVRIRLNDEPPIVSLIGNTSVVAIGSYIDYGVSIVSSLSLPVNTFVDIISVTSYTNIPIGSVGSFIDFTTSNSYVLNYRSIDNVGNMTTGLSRIVNIISPTLYKRPLISSLSSLFTSCNGIMDICSYGNTYVAIGRSVVSTSAGIKIYKSLDKLNWTSIIPTFQPFNPVIAFTSIDSSGSSVIACLYRGANSTYLYRSTDLYTWTLVFTQEQNLKIIYRNGIYFACIPSLVWYSLDDGLTWTAITQSSFQYNGGWVNVEYANGIYIITSSNNFYLLSTNGGTAWTLYNFTTQLSTPYRIWGLLTVYNNQFVIMTSNTQSVQYNYYARSSNGINWNIEEMTYYANIRNSNNSTYMINLALFKFNSKLYTISIIVNNPTYGTKVYSTIYDGTAWYVDAVDIFDSSKAFITSARPLYDTIPFISLSFFDTSYAYINSIPAPFITI